MIAEQIAPAIDSVIDDEVIKSTIGAFGELIVRFFV